MVIVFTPMGRSNNDPCMKRAHQ